MHNKNEKVANVVKIFLHTDYVHLKMGFMIYSFVRKESEGYIFQRWDCNGTNFLIYNIPYNCDEDNSILADYFFEKGGHLTDPNEFAKKYLGVEELHTIPHKNWMVPLNNLPPMNTRVFIVNKCTNETLNDLDLYQYALLTLCKKLSPNSDEGEPSVEISKKTVSR